MGKQEVPGPARPDIVIVIAEHGSAKKWNLGSDGSLWAMAPNSVDEVGCIHTCQALEVDYIGVNLGPDLVARGGKLITQPDKRSKTNKSLSGYKSLLKTDPGEARGRADRIIRNPYRTLLTRGLKGCYVFCTDPETQEYFRRRLQPRESARARSDGRQELLPPGRLTAAPSPKLGDGNKVSNDPRKHSAD